MRPDADRVYLKLFEFEAVERRSVVAGFDSRNITSNAGALLLGQVDRGVGLVRRFADCFIDRRDPRYVEHQVETLVGQRIFGLALGYEDLNDHDELRKDPTFAVLAGKLSPVLRTDCEPLAGKSTLNRLEHTSRRHASKYHKIDCDDAQVDAHCWWIFSSKRMSAHRARSCWISTTPTFRCTASRKAASSTARTNGAHPGSESLARDDLSPHAGDGQHGNGESRRQKIPHHWGSLHGLFKTAR